MIMLTLIFKSSLTQTSLNLRSTDFDYLEKHPLKGLFYKPVRPGWLAFRASAARLSTIRKNLDVFISEIGMKIFPVGTGTSPLVTGTKLSSTK